MSARIRRSWLVVPLSKAEQIAQAPGSGADVIALDLVEFVAEEDKPAARERTQAAIRTAHAGGAEVFAQVDPELLVADLRACAWPGLTGVIVSRLESAQQVAEVDGLLGELEARRGILHGTLEIVAALETARGNHSAYDISRASPSNVAGAPRHLCRASAPRVRRRARSSSSGGSTGASLGRALASWSRRARSASFAR